MKKKKNEEIAQQIGYWWELYDKKERKRKGKQEENICGRIRRMCCRAWRKKKEEIFNIIKKVRLKKERIIRD